jgi:predicted dehydrogenase
MATKLRIGVLGAARNVPFSLLQPVRSNADLAAKLDIVGVASLETSAAESIAKEWQIQKAYTFEEMLADPTIDAVYNVMPSHLRCQWSVKALIAGKHVLSETPTTSNAREAVVLQRAAEDAGRVLLEGTHPTCHPVTKRVREMICQGDVGHLESITLDMPVGHSLQGKACMKAGALMGLGCHGVAIVRALANEEPQVVRATAQRTQDSPDIDFAINFDLQFPSGASANVSASVDAATRPQPTTYKICGSTGTIHVKEFFTQGKSSNEIIIEHWDESGDTSKETVDNAVETRDTFYFQWMAFAEEIFIQKSRASIGMPWDYRLTRGPTDAVWNMSTIDSIYRAANMQPRPVAAAPPSPYDRIGMSKL